MLVVGGGVVIAVCVVVIASCWRKTKPEPQPLPPEDHPSSPSINMESVKIMEIIGEWLKCQLAYIFELWEIVQYMDIIIMIL